MLGYGSPLGLLRSSLSQLFPPAATFTAEDLVPPGSLSGRVVVVTGANSGIGYELVKALYRSGARIWLLCRSQQRAERAMREIEASYSSVKVEPQHTATLRLLQLDLADLASVRNAASILLAQETRLDILFNIAGVGNVPKGTVTTQGLEAHMGINCVGPFLLTKLLLPLLRSTATRRDISPGSVRILWTASLSVEELSPRGGVDFAQLEKDKQLQQAPPRAYAASKCGNLFLARECARRFGRVEDGGIVSAAVNPGQLRTEAWRYVSGAIMFFVRMTMYEARMGALPMLYAGFALEVGEDGNNGCYVLPWGRLAQGPFPREDIEQALQEGAAQRFWRWCDGVAEQA